MKFAGIQFPDPLLDALRDGRLVVFAGSGVSRGSPACLPDFKLLATSIAEGTGQTLDASDQEDVFLGRLADFGVEVRSLAAHTLQKNCQGNPPGPTDLHRDLLRMFRESGSVRIVTTNFDLLFHVAARDLFESAPDLFRAPALPLGGSFAGIVHVHGCLDRPADMVLTDSDFGRAYLTEGWARRFLVDLFRSWTVLFVGYSHNDTVMKYLARALPSAETATRFALTERAQTERWTTLGIAPVVYPKEPNDNHVGLTRGIGRLADHASGGVLERQREISEIARRPPPLGEEDVGIIEDALADPSKTRFFTAFASGAEWIDCLDQMGHLDLLFGNHALGTCQRHLAWWLAEQVARGHSDKVFLLISRHGMRLHPDLWRELAIVVGSSNDPTMDEKTLSRWISCLLASAPQESDRSVLLRLGERCIAAGLTECIVALFDALATSRLALKPPIAFDDEQDELLPDLEIELIPNVGEFEISELWERGLKPKLDIIAEPLLSIAAAHLTARHSTLRAWQKADGKWDPDSWRRHAIEPHDQDRYRGHEDVLIDVARDCLEWLASNRSDAATRWCDQFRAAEQPLLRRLCIYAVHVRRDLTPEKKLDWLLSNTDLHDRAACHELFRSMQAVYPHATREQRKRAVQAICAYRFTHDQDDGAELHSAMQHFDWLHWLSDADPDCVLAGRALGALLERYPDLKPRAHPDLTHWSSPLHGSVSPWTVDQLLDRPAVQWLGELLSFRQVDFLGPDRHGLVEAVSEAAKRDFDWGLALADALSGQENWTIDLWTALLRSWRKPDDRQLRKICALLGQPRLQAEQGGRIADVLHDWLKKRRASSPHDLLAQANTIAIGMWDRIDRSEPTEGCDSWHSLAADRPAGVLARYWLIQLDMLREQPRLLPETLVAKVHSALSTIVGDSSIAGRQGRSVLAGQLDFLLAAAEEWTKENVVPLFREDPGTDDFQAVWDGFLTAGNLTPYVAEQMEDAFLSALPFLPTAFLTDWRRSRFVEYFTVMLVHFVDNPVDEWIPAFFEHADADSGKLFVSQVRRLLQCMEDSPQRNLWDRWLMRFWTNRINGVPRRLTDDEIHGMTGWLPHMKDLFPDAVDLANKMRSVPPRSSTFLRDISHEGHIARFPVAVAKILIHLGRHASPGFEWIGIEALVDEILGAKLPAETRQQLSELAARLGTEQPTA